MEAQQCVQLTDTNRSRAWSHLEWEQSFLIDCSITNLLRNIFSTIFTDLKSHLRLDVKILCFLYDSYVCCVVVSLRKRRLRKKIILVSYRTYRGNDMTCRRKRIYALYVCTDVFWLFGLWLLSFGFGFCVGFYFGFCVGGLSGAVSGEASERVKGREKRTDVLI